MKNRDIHKLIAESGGICNFPECGEKLIHNYKDGTHVRLIDFCHIIGESSKGPRGHPKKSELMANNPDNIILLCSKHHKIIDNNEIEYPIEKLRQMKKNHIQWINEKLNGLKEPVWTLIIHAGNVSGSGAPNLDKEFIFHDFFGTHIIAEIEEIIIDDFLTKTKNWLEYKKKQEIWWHNFKKEDKKPKKFLICSINFIPLVIHLGYLIHDTFISKIYQYHREENTWNWKCLDETEAKRDFFFIKKLYLQDENIEEIALSISISGTINEDDIFEIINNSIKIIRIIVEEPNRTWLKYEEQLIDFQKKFINLIDGLVQLYKKLKLIHLFYAGPTPIAYILGSSINPTIHPQFILYNYFTKNSPKYSKAFEIN